MIRGTRPLQGCHCFGNVEQRFLKAIDRFLKPLPKKEKQNTTYNETSVISHFALISTSDIEFTDKLEHGKDLEWVNISSLAHSLDLYRDRSID